MSDRSGVWVRGDFEAAPRPLVALATLANRRFEKLGQERLHRAADLRFPVDRGGEKAAEHEVA